MSTTFVEVDSPRSEYHGRTGAVVKAPGHGWFEVRVEGEVLPFRREELKGFRVTPDDEAFMPELCRPCLAVGECLECGLFPALKDGEPLPRTDLPQPLTLTAGDTLELLATLRREGGDLDDAPGSLYARLFDHYDDCMTCDVPEENDYVRSAL